ncbi:MAG: DUF6922 domain-containing protein [Bacillota bacterium]
MSIDPILDENAQCVLRSLIAAAMVTGGALLDALDDERHRGLIVRTVLARAMWEQMLWLFRRYGRDGVRWELMFIEQPLPEDPHPAAGRWRCRRPVVTNRGPER